MTNRLTIDQAKTKLLDADSAVADEFAEHRHSWPVKALSTASEIGDQPQLRMISGALFAIGLVTSNRRLMRAGARMLAAHELATIAKTFVKHRVDRKRPRSAAHRGEVELARGHHRSKELSSFPSGHTAGAIAVTRAFAREYPEYQAAALTAGGMVAVAQIPRCTHYLTDVGAGAAIGAGAEQLLGLVWPSEDGDDAA